MQQQMCAKPLLFQSAIVVSWYPLDQRCSQQCIHYISTCCVYALLGGSVSAVVHVSHQVSVLDHLTLLTKLRSEKQSPDVGALLEQGRACTQRGRGQGVRGLRSAIFRNFPQFPAISRNFPQFPTISPQLLLACPPCVLVAALCLCAQLLQNNKLQCFPAPEIIQRFLPVPQEHAAVWA